MELLQLQGKESSWHANKSSRRKEDKFCLKSIHFSNGCWGWEKEKHFDWSWSGLWLLYRPSSHHLHSLANLLQQVRNTPWANWTVGHLINPEFCLLRLLRNTEAQKVQVQSDKNLEKARRVHEANELKKKNKQLGVNSAAKTTTSVKLKAGVSKPPPTVTNKQCKRQGTYVIKVTDKN